MNLESEIFPVNLANRFAQFGLQCVIQEYPHVQYYWLESSQDLIPHRQLNPAFYGCLDWHSAVHNHWMLTRLIKYFPDGDFVSFARDILTKNITPEHIKIEAKFLQSQPRFECPYGLAWFLQLIAELTEWEDEQAKILLEYLQPLKTVIINNIHKWLLTLSYPNRTGLHNQTAFALGLIWDWATLTQHQKLLEEVAHKIQKFYYHDYNYSLHCEPLGDDFLSPCLAEADLMRRILPHFEFGEWLTIFLPHLPQKLETDWFSPIIINNPEDYGQSHFDGLNLSRAWMLEGIISGLLPTDNRIPALKTVANLHYQVGLNPVSGNFYGGSHWLGSFAVYLGTKRGLNSHKK
ncbi:DUF2891 domain-containing protein [Planktothrix agardhii 1801]|uniref:DUF2891 domain-containing protein n=1 Tax=Planktothrix agardhii TaxID=1160 RepID=UPI001F289F48|nr:DUF2891 domain-containing protein [Planktothrix agardhii]MCF3625126.1 DUF2891 domain-containing protein [Planktothrix agardhii 1801]